MIYSNFKLSHKFMSTIIYIELDIIQRITSVNTKTFHDLH